jgi:nucleotide-binding universal stress UspA family protein
MPETLPPLDRRATPAISDPLPPPPTGPIMVASDGSSDADAAFTIARAVQVASGASVQLVSIVAPFAMFGAVGEFSAIPEHPYAEAIRLRRQAIEAQCARLVAPGADWTTTVRGGEPASTISDLARALNARLLVTGRGQHAPMERVFHDETVLRLLQLGDTPVFAATDALTSLPQRVLIATDFSPFSTYAARVAATAMASDAVVFLVHVRQRYDQAVSLVAERGPTDGEAIHAGLSELAALLTREHAGLRIDVMMREGNVYRELLGAVQHTQADLVVSATHGYGFFRRMVLGSIASTLVRQAPCSVLCVPGHAATVAAARSGASQA